MSHITRNDLHKHFILTITFLLYTFLFTILLLSIERFTSINWEICSFYWEVYSVYLSFYFHQLRGYSFYHEWLSFNLEVCFSLSLILLHSIERFTSIIREVYSLNWEIGSFNWEVYSLYLSFYFYQSTGLLQSIERFTSFYLSFYFNLLRGWFIYPRGLFI
jgi:hypothetical protein